MPMEAVARIIALIATKRRIHPRVHDEPNDRVLSAILRPMECADGVQVDSRTSERTNAPALPAPETMENERRTDTDGESNALACPMRKRDRRFHRRLRISSPCADVQDRSKGLP